VVLALGAAASSADVETFQTLATEAKNMAAAFGRAAAAKRWHALASALDITRLLIEWEHASLTAAIDSDRFLRAARLRLRQLREEIGSDPFTDRLIEVLSVIEGELDFSRIGSLRQQLAAIPLPVAIYADPQPQVPDWVREREGTPEERAPDLTVAFVEFKIDGTTAERIQALRPRENHDLDIAVRVSRWPETATSLVLSPISIEPPSSYDLPSFRFTRPSGYPPYVFQQRGRMILHAPQGLRRVHLNSFIRRSSSQPLRRSRFQLWGRGLSASMDQRPIASRLPDIAILTRGLWRCATGYGLNR